MESLRGIKSLEVVDLVFTKVGDAGLRELEGLPNLKEVSTGGSRVTPEGVRRFQLNRPDVQVRP